MNNTLRLTLLVTLLCSPAHAATYQFTGEFFDTIQDSTVISGTYSTGNRITGFIELASVLPANLSVSTAEGSDYSNFAIDYSFTDGRQTFSMTDFSLGSGLSTISFSTDSSGSITGWLIQLLNPLTGFGDFGGRIYSDGTIDVGEITACSAANNCTALAVDQGRVLGGGGWTLQDDPTQVIPVPATLPLLLGGLGLAGLIASRRRSPV